MGVELGDLEDLVRKSSAYIGLDAVNCFKYYYLTNTLE